MELTAEQIALIGFVATITVSIIKLAITYFSDAGLKFDKRIVVIGTYVIALALTYGFNPQVIPLFPSVSGVEIYDVTILILQWLMELLKSAMSQFGFATLVYLVLTKKIEEGLEMKLQ